MHTTLTPCSLDDWKNYFKYDGDLDGLSLLILEELRRMVSNFSRRVSSHISLTEDKGEQNISIEGDPRIFQQTLRNNFYLSEALQKAISSRICSCCTMNSVGFQLFFSRERGLLSIEHQRRFWKNQVQSSPNWFIVNKDGSHAIKPQYVDAVSAMFAFFEQSIRTHTYSQTHGPESRVQGLKISVPDEVMVTSGGFYKTEGAMFE